MNEPQEITIQEGSTNVYADLGYADAAEMQRESRLAGGMATLAGGPTPDGPGGHFYRHAKWQAT